MDPKILENLGVSFEQLGMYHVAVHEMAHFMADMAKPYAVQRGWEKLYLLDHPEESFAPVLVDAVAAEQERFAEGIAQLMLKERLAELDIPEQATDVAFKYMNQNTIRGHAYTYLLLHDVSDEGMGLDEEGYRKAANLGYGYPLTLEQLKERLTYMFDYVGMQPEDVKKKYAELQEVNWREHTAGAIYHELPKAPELPKLQTNERKKKRIRRFVGSAMLAASIYKSALFNKGESEDN